MREVAWTAVPIPATSTSGAYHEDPIQGTAGDAYVAVFRAHDARLGQAPLLG